MPTWLSVQTPEGEAGLLFLVHVVTSLVASGHVLLNKESERSATGWIALVWLSPIVGSVMYVLLGVNRVRRRAVRLRAVAPGRAPRAAGAGSSVHLGHLAPMRRAIDALTPEPLVEGNAVVPLRDGDEAYPAMLDAIGRAERTVALQTFLFDDDAWGRRFVDALAAARARGVDVRVLIDGIGVWFSWPAVVLPALRSADVPFRRFLWSADPRRMTLLNLRNHRKILVVDGRVGFTGGMNVRGSFVGEGVEPRTAEQDLHFRVEGPVVGQLVDLFAGDWAFDGGPPLEGEGWTPPLAPAGEVAARVIPGGPDALDRLSLVLLEAVGCARHAVRLQTPYFLPEEPLELALIAAARRGVAVDVVVPAASNHPLIDAATRAQLPRLLSHGVRVWAQRPPFDHGKLLVVDDVWSCVGSANWDPRSLRLNFEMLVEAHGAGLAAELAAIFEAKRARSEPVRIEALAARSLAARLLDGAARLLKPYL